jgi:hypothetical protein
VYKNKNIDDTIDSLTNIILQTMDLAIPWNTVSKPKFPHWFSPILKRYIRKNNYFHRRHRKNTLEQYNNKFSYYQKLVKITIKFDRLNWYKSIDHDFKTQPAKFWN